MENRTKYMLWGVALTVFILRCVYRWFFPNLYTDTLLLIEVSTYYLEEGQMVHRPIEGSGMAGPFVPLTVMPKGYVYFLSFLSYVIPSPMHRVFIGDCLALGILLFSSIKLLEVLIPDNRVPQLIFLGFLGVSPAFLHPLPATDLMSLALLSLSMALLFWSSDRNVIVFLSSVFLCLTVSLRFAYIPFLAALPTCFFLVLATNFTLKQKWLALTIYSILPFCFLIFLYAQKKNLPFLSDQHAQLFWEHLLHIDFFPVKALVYFNRDHLAYLAQHFFFPPEALAFLMVFMSILMLAVTFQTWYKWLRSDFRHLEQCAIFFAGIFLANVTLLVYLSATSPPETDWLPFWTFVMETRYFAPSQYVLVLTLTYLTSRSNNIWTEFQARWPLFRA
ncbi:MAG: hypothetical protein AAF694_15110 [Bacteroidota bacterium]